MFTFPRNSELLRIIVTIIAVVGIAAHACAGISYFCCRCNPVGMDFRSPMVKYALTSVIPYKQQTRYEPIMKLIAEGGGVLAYMCLLFAALKRSKISCALFLTFALMYLSGIGLHLFILFKMWKFGIKANAMSDEIMSAGVTALFEYMGIVSAILLLVLFRRQGKNQRFDLTVPDNKEIPTSPCAGGIVIHHM